MSEPRSTLTVAAAQVASVAGEVSTNAHTAALAVREAADRGARLVVLPELFLSGYDMDTIGARPDDCDLDAAHLNDARLDDLVNACRETAVVALAGASVRHADGRRTISLLAVDTVVRSVYDKQHLCGDEVVHFQPGERGVVLEVDGWPLALSVCYDGCFPEHARAGADAGALVYVASMAYFVGGEHRRDLYYRARAVENGMFVVTSGLVGTCGAGELSGGSAVHDPEGRTLASVGDGTSGIAVARLDHDTLTATRGVHRMYADHRPSLGTPSFLRTS